MSNQVINLPDGPIRIKRPIVKTDIKKAIKILESIANGG